MLNYDEEEVLKVLLKLYKEQNNKNISGSFKDFPAKYQICYKEIISRLHDKKFIINFDDFIAGDFVLTITSYALRYFTDKENIITQEEKTTLEAIKKEPAKTQNVNSDSSSNSIISQKQDYPEQQKENESSYKENINRKYKSDDYYINMNIISKLKNLEKQAEILEDNQKKELEEILTAIKNILENLRKSSTITPDRKLIEKIFISSSKSPWIYSEIINIFGNMFIAALLK